MDTKTMRLMFLIGLPALMACGLARADTRYVPEAAPFLGKGIRDDTRIPVVCTYGGLPSPLFSYCDETPALVFNLSLRADESDGRAMRLATRTDGHLVFVRGARDLSWTAEATPGRFNRVVFKDSRISAWIVPLSRMSDPAWQTTAAELAGLFRDHPEWLTRIEEMMPPATLWLDHEQLAGTARAIRAARTDDAPGLESLLAGGLSPDANTGFGIGLLHRAAVANATNCVELLLEHGADPLRLDGFGRTPREEALLHGAVEAAALLPERPIPEDSP